ncbi:MAG: hypothetical protein FWF77_02300 [Defluviitaleaceae bacterium]|nr:hypothetical protein [Defluviitaleaceae bacterium]
MKMAKTMKNKAMKFLCVVLSIIMSFSTVAFASEISDFSDFLPVIGGGGGVALAEAAPFSYPTTTVNLVGTFAEGANGPGWLFQNSTFYLRDGADIIFSGSTSVRRVVILANASVAVSFPDGGGITSSVTFPRLFSAVTLQPGATLNLSTSGTTTLGIARQ